MHSFDRYYFRHLPILDQVTSIEKLTSNSPILFWTILLVSCQWHPTLSYLYPSLAAPHEDLLYPVLHSAIWSIETLQALLILCCWPVPKIRQILDPSWNYSGLATNSAMQMGLHKPSSTYDWFQTGVPTTAQVEMPSETLRSRVLTWLSCFNINIQYVDLANHLRRIVSILTFDA
jgi:Fungal specific transcription factor domain